MPKRSIILVKVGGELLETRQQLKSLATTLVKLSTQQPVIVVHGGGREIDKELDRLGIAKQSVDGLRITDAATLDVVVGVLAGRVNTRLVAAIGAAGGHAVGLTGVDAKIVQVRKARRYRSSNGESVDLGFVGTPKGNQRQRPELLRELTGQGYIPVVASIGCDQTGRLFNVNADTLAADLAQRVGASRLVIAGTTPGVLDPRGKTIPVVTPENITKLIREKQASAGMVTKLLACQDANAKGVDRVEIVDGKHPNFLSNEQECGVTRVTN
jgi:acetylglutamate kinase